MKKLFTTMILAIGFVAAAVAQKEVKYVKMYYKDLKMETNDIVIIVDNAVSTEGETKFKLKIENKTNDYLILKPEECKFIINGKEQKPKEKWLVISPNESDFRIVNLKGAGYNAVKNYQFVLDGLYRVDANTKGIATPDFKLPASQNEFETGPFTNTLGKVSKETDKTEVKISVTYTGDKIGFVFPSKVSVKMPDGNTYANAKSKSDAIMMVKGDSDSYKLKWERMEGGKMMDMQKVDMMIQWNDAFAEVSPVKMKAETIQMEFDEVASNEKGK
ncbi:MAG: hypothetical protein J0L87_11910 [Bacteroidetes bacterium]|nr:hypothetical protein [Bacteroidota bacterium]